MRRRRHPSSQRSHSFAFTDPDSNIGKVEVKGDDEIATPGVPFNQMVASPEDYTPGGEELTFWRESIAEDLENPIKAADS
ncbi:MAG: hypothetical protein AB1491_02355 [Thermodesulfobacteriota bacterium]